MSEPVIKLMRDVAEQLQGMAGDIEDLSKEIDRLNELLDDELYIRLKADYNKGHLSHAGWLEAREKSAWSRRRERKQ